MSTLGYKKEDDTHENTRISLVSMVTAVMLCVVSRCLCRPDPISMSEVGLIGRSRLWPLVVITTGNNYLFIGLNQ
jgi:hypothetical protein